MIASGAPTLAGPARVLGGASERSDLGLLAGPDAGPLLRAALPAEGVELGTWSTHAVHHRPGAA
jgi:hypothetical protein